MNNSTIEKETEEKKSVTDKANEFLGLAFFVEFMIAVQLDLMLGVLVNLRNFWFKPFNLWVNSMVSLGFFIFYCKFVYSLMDRSIKLEKVRQSKLELTEDEMENILVVHDLKKWDFLKELLKDDTSFIGGII